MPQFKFNDPVVLRRPSSPFPLSPIVGYFVSAYNGHVWVSDQPRDPNATAAAAVQNSITIGLADDLIHLRHSPEHQAPEQSPLRDHMEARKTDPRVLGFAKWQQMEAPPEPEQPTPEQALGLQVQANRQAATKTVHQNFESYVRNNRAPPPRGTPEPTLQELMQTYSPIYNDGVWINFAGSTRSMAYYLAHISEASVMDWVLESVPEKHCKRLQEPLREYVRSLAAGASS